ncbi:hypothetical protein BBBOND_0306690 [Babesia bigemina]|uniref:6-Cys domain-containing protein n=1 Tax=Babesia bigemina TaxID=5866 RepID=A0A061DE18_BABBI|nr:hypothetical protein BBBOND_0306690 [Babesia bigemina]CDR96765.1 hypothetical protein BBBOND_0306690 [Babesia bigemina]|eukprot:XP_012768951.1 hypothetical protein BBBOND_0306690 [Babesia bigemina]
MAKFIGAPLAICAIILQFIKFINALQYDFSSSLRSLVADALVASHINMDDLGMATLMCPRQINGIEYVWHPQPTADHNFCLETYVIENGEFHSVPLSTVVITEIRRLNFWKTSRPSQTDLHIDLMDDYIYAITENRFVFICGPRGLVLSEALQAQLASLDGFAEIDAHPWEPRTPLVDEIAKIGGSLGVVFLHRGRKHKLMQGCGSRPSPLFASDNVTVDSETGTRSCMVDPMSELPIGFICQGRIEPDDCMKYLLDKTDGVVTAPTPHLYRNFNHRGKWVIAQYFDGLALRAFKGECRCINPKTGRVKARIEVRWKTEYICDITSMIARNRFNPISGPWCSVMLHPGATLTIKLPKQTVKSAAADLEFEEDGDVEEDALTAPFSQLPSIHEYETEFKPDVSLILRQRQTIYDIDLYDEILIQDALTGGAFEVDVSQMEGGEVKLKYRMDKPLALRSGYNSFLYHWTFISRNENVLEKIRAVVNVSFAPTYRYNIIGCDRWKPGMFDPANDSESLAIKVVGNGMALTSEWLVNVSSGEQQAGIQCGRNEDLFPNNCESTGYDISSNQVAPFPTSVRNATLYPVRGFQVFDMSFQNVPVSHACSCVDEHGYETSRLVLRSNRYEEYTYTVSREAAYQWLMPYSLLPWNEVALFYGDHTHMQSIMLHNMPQIPIKLHSGTKILMRCVLDEGVYDDENDAVVPPTWLPDYPRHHHYKVDTTTYGPMLISKLNGERIAGTKGGLDISISEYTDEYCDLAITSNSGAILVSKDPDHSEYVPITFVCGKELSESDFGQVNDNALAADIPPPVAPLEDYTWNVVQIDVEMTDPYMQGCGITDSRDMFFKPETPKLYDTYRQLQFGCKINIQAAEEAAFYCPAPYVLDPPNCFYQVSVNGEVKNLMDISQSLVASRTNHFVTLKFDSARIGPGETLHQTPPLECRCVTIKGVILSTIQIENYYSKEWVAQM